MAWILSTMDGDIISNIVLFLLGLFIALNSIEDYIFGECNYKL